MPEQMELKLRQIAYSDMLILSKTDLVSREEVGQSGLARPAVPPISPGGGSPLRSAAGNTALQRPARSRANGFRPSSGGERQQRQLQPRSRASPAEVRTWSFETDLPMSLEALRATAKGLPSAIYRCKGVVHSSDAPDRRAILQVVGETGRYLSPRGVGGSHSAYPDRSDWCARDLRGRGVRAKFSAVHQPVACELRRSTLLTPLRYPASCGRRGRKMEKHVPDRPRHGGSFAGARDRDASESIPMLSHKA